MFIRTLSRCRRGAAVSLAATALCCVFASQASAETFIFAFKGVPTTSGTPTSSVFTDDDAVSTRTIVLRGGAVIDHRAVTFDLLPGDIIQAQNFTTGALLASVAFDGTPALDANTCVGSAAFSGTRIAGATVSSVFAYRRERVGTGPYAFDRTRDVIRGSVFTAGAASFSGAFRSPIPAGHVLSATQTHLLAGSGSYDVTVERFAGACPPPPPPPPPPPDTTPPSGRLFLPAFLRRSTLMRTGVTLRVDINERGTVKVDVYADNGAKLPVLAGAAAATKRKPKLIRLAGGQKSTPAAGRVQVKIRPTSLGRKRIKPRRRTKAIVLTTLTDAAGNRARLPAKRTTFR